jgi:hypothetical protein
VPTVLNVWYKLNNVALVPLFAQPKLDWKLCNQKNIEINHFENVYFSIAIFKKISRSVLSWIPWT